LAIPSKPFTAPQLSFLDALQCIIDAIPQMNIAIIRRRKMQKPRRRAGLFCPVAGTWPPVLLDYDVSCARALLTLLDVESDGLTLGQRLEAATLDGAVMDEDILGAVGRGDEAKASIVTEPLNCTCSHYGYLWLN
jgi:hypothetical protein